MLEITSLDKLKSIISNMYSDKRKFMSYLISIGGLTFCLIFFTYTSEGNLWNAYNLGIIIEAVVVYMVISMGATFIYAMGDMDISVGAQMGVYSIVMILVSNRTGSLIIGFLSILVLALLSAVFNAYVSVLLGLPAIVTSIFLSGIFSGVQYLAMENLGKNTISINIDMGAFIEPKVMLVIMIVGGLVLTWLFHYTTIGKYARIIGSNIEATKQCGVNVQKIKIICYLIFGFMVAVGSLILTARTESAGRGTGSGYAMDIMIILILGGMPLSGGIPSKVMSGIIGSLTYVILSNGLTLVGLETSVSNVVKAIIFLVVILITSRKRNGVLPR